jgi:hypothetical protein
VRFANAVFAGKKLFLSLEEALDGGRCNLCGQLLIDHPRDKKGVIAIDRHHEINIAFTQAYKLLTGKEFPLDEDNLYWVGRGCHLEYHERLDPTYHDIGVVLNEKKLKKHFTESEQKKHQRRLVRLCDKYMSTVGPLDYGKDFRTTPAPLPEFMVRQKILVTP